MRHTLNEAEVQPVASCVMGIVPFVATQVLRFLQAFAVAWGVAYLIQRSCRCNPVRRLPRIVGVRRGVLSIACLAAGTAAGISWLRPPLPSVQDEFSYLLAADTFSHGRLTNPAHPMWQHFETPHVIQQPTYASKYPPGQGGILALGETVAEDLRVGLWVSAGLVAGAATWMLRGWMSHQWALLGGLLVAFHPGIQLIWTQSYWGGNIAFAGSALVLGAYPRLRRSMQCRDAGWLAFGFAILANSRPFEGLVASLPVAAAMSFWLVRAASRARGTSLSRTGQHEIMRPPTRRLRWRLGTRSVGEAPAPVIRVCLTLGAVLAIAAIWMAYYNWRVTGHPGKMPYMVHEEAYGATPFFLWQSLGPLPEYRHERIARLHGWLRETYLYQGTWRGFLGEKSIALVNLWQFYLGIPLSIPLLALPWILRDRAYWLPLTIVGASWGALLTTTWVNPHYFAPAGPALLLLVVQGLRRMAVQAKLVGRRSSTVPSPAATEQPDGSSNPAGPARAILAVRRGRGRMRLVWALIVAQLFEFLLYAWFHVGQPPPRLASDRADVERRLLAMPGKHMVLVRYGRDYSIHSEWVQNSADIEKARIVWAREMNPAADRQFVKFFRDRQAWLLRLDGTRPRLSPYPETADRATAE